MKKQTVKRVLALGLAAVMTAGMLAGCGGNGKSGGDDGDKYTFWIYRTDGEGMYYEDYKDAAAVQYIDAQLWDAENGGIGKDGKGVDLDFDFMVPVTGNEKDNFNTMIGTAEYPEAMDLTVSAESPQAMVENGTLMEITEYVEKYMPNYLALLEKYSELKPLVSVADEKGDVHYYALYRLGDSVRQPWDGYLYRRDWVVEYAEPTEYVWDWEDDYVKENGHPEVTPLAKAQEENNLNGWKKNEVTEFTSDDGADPKADYTDNVIFPSGTSDPLTISDWEWMFEAFEKAIADRGWSEDSNAYSISIPYNGNSMLGDLVSSFGGGTGHYYINDGEVSYDGTSENFGTYVECMQNWWNKGWLDSQFYTRATDIFYTINTPGVTQGKVGMWLGDRYQTFGDTARATCLDERDQQKMYAYPAALPINDMYGSEDQMYKEPDALYQSSRVEGKLGITTKCEEKDEESLAAFFTFLDWTYSVEGAEVMGMGLTEEQIASVELEPNIYEEYDLKSSYEKSTDKDGKTVYTPALTADNPNAKVLGATQAFRMVAGLALNANTGEYYSNDGTPALYLKAYEEWGRYLNTGGTADYIGLLNAEDGAAFAKKQTEVIDYVSQNLPKVIMGEMKWEDYTEGVEALNPDEVVPAIQKVVDLARK